MLGKRNVRHTLPVRREEPYSCAHDAFVDAIRAGALPPGAYRIVRSMRNAITVGEMVPYCRRLGLVYHRRGCSNISAAAGTPVILVVPSGGPENEVHVEFSNGVDQSQLGDHVQGMIFFGPSKCNRKHH